MVVEITYRGIRIARGKLEGEGDPGFLPFEAPMPVGTRVYVHVEGEVPREAIVTQVVEQESSAKSPPGMRLRWAPAAAVAEAPIDEGTRTTVMAVPIPPPGADADDGVPEPADSSARTIMMEAVAPDEEIEPADSPRQTLTNMPAIRDPDAEPGNGGGGKKKRRRR